MDIIGRISRDLENEGVNLSNDKIHKILVALRALIKVYYKVFVKKRAEGVEGADTALEEQLVTQLKMRSSLKEAIIRALVGCIGSMVKDQLVALGADAEVKSLFQQISLRQLISFDVVLKQDICTEHCKQLKKTSAIMIFKIAETSPLTASSQGAAGVPAVTKTPQGYVTKTVECSLEEVKKFREEMLRISEALS